jgi:glutamate carboxypeptidase
VLQLSQSLDDVVRGIIEWANIESPTFAPDRVGAMIDHVSESLRALGGRVERIDLSQTYAHAARVRFGPDVRGAGTLILAHLDTVHPIGTKDGPLPIRIEGDQLFGPGVFDMKGGLYIACAAVKELLAGGHAFQAPLTFLLIPDEEIGSPTSRSLIESEARDHARVLVPEPARLGRVITGRHAFARFTLTTNGKPAHAGADNAVGRSAIRAMGRLVETIESATDLSQLISFSVGVISGGQWVNVIPTVCHAEVLAVASTESLLAKVQAFMNNLSSPLPDVALTVTPGPVRPLFKPHPGTMQLYERARRLAVDLGFALEHGQFGGGSDGNFTGALEIPTLDGLGVCGAGAHTHGEHLLASSIIPRMMLLTKLVLELDKE